MFIKQQLLATAASDLEPWIPKIAKQHICFIEGDEEKIEPSETTVAGPTVELTAEELAAAEEAKKLETKAESEPPAPKTVPAWQVAAMQKRIDKLTAQLKGKTESVAPLDPAGNVPVSELEARAEVLATAKAQQAEFDRACTATVELGRKEFTDFNEKVQDLLQVRDVTDPASVQAYNTLIAAAIETGDGAKIIHKLGGDLEEAARIMGLSPVKMGVALAKLASATVKTEPDVSGAPKPITPLNGGRRASFEQIEPDDPERAGKLSMETWMERRNKQVTERGLR